MTIEAIKTFLSMIVELHDRAGAYPEHKYNCPEKLILAEGMTFTGLGKIAKMQPKRCYNNSFDIAIQRKDLSYCEGYACGVANFPTQHAWLCDANGVIFDPTWEHVTPNPDDYLGLVFDTEFLIQNTLRKKFVGVFHETTGYDLGVLDGNFKLAKTPWMAANDE